MENVFEIKLSEEEKERVCGMESDIERIRREMEEYVSGLQCSLGLDKPKLCILSYRNSTGKRIGVGKYGMVRYEMREYSRLAYISWRYDSFVGGFRCGFRSVSSDGGIGNAISTYGFEDVWYEVLDGLTVDEGRRILKDVKKGVGKSKSV